MAEHRFLLNLPRNRAAVLPPNMAYTDNASCAFRSTSSACLDLFYEAMQHTKKEDLIRLLAASWEEDPNLTLKLIFHLRDVRHGKGAAIEFHHALCWLFETHPSTLLHNVQFIARHGYWKDLAWLVKFLMGDKVAMVAKRLKNKRKPRTPVVAGPARASSVLTPVSCPLEEFIQKRIDGTVSKPEWKRYLYALPDDEAREQAKLRFQAKIKALHSQLHQESLARKKALKDKYAANLAEKMKEEKFADLYNAVVQAFVTALQQDVKKLKEDQRLDSNALAGKWAPSIPGAMDRRTALGKNIARALYASDHQSSEEDKKAEDFDTRAYVHYRKNVLTPLRAAINIPERLMSKRKWSDIEYERVPSVCMKRNKKTFLEHDPERFTEFLDDVKEGKKKMAAGALLPHQIIKQLLEEPASTSKSKKTGRAPELDQVAELQWNSCVENLKKSGRLESALAVCDVSGSMAGEPVLVAIALSLLTASVSKPPYNGTVCSFSLTPKLHKVNQPTLKERACFVRGIDSGSTTNMQAVFDLALSLATDSQLPREEMVKTIFVFSDMEFNACGGKEYETDHQLIKRKFEAAGYPLPRVVFWNLRGSSDHSKPVTKDELNVALVSGFSGRMMKTFLESGEFSSPYQTMLNTLGTHYDHLQVCD